MLVYERPDHKEWGFHGDVTDDGRYLVITVWQGDRRPKYRILYKDLERAGRAGRRADRQLRRTSTRSSTTTARSSGSRPTTTPRAAG